MRSGSWQDQDTGAGCLMGRGRYRAWQNPYKLNAVLRVPAKQVANARSSRAFRAKPRPLCFRPIGLSKDEGVRWPIQGETQNEGVIRA